MYNCPPLVSEPYLLLYLPVNDNMFLRKTAKTYAEEHGLKVLEISTKLLQGDDETIIVYTSAGVEEFLSAIKYAKAVFTNSFHAICFSVIFERQFFAFSRKYFGKIKDFCGVMGMPERFFDDNNFRELPSIDYSIVRRIWQQKRQESIEWIFDALGINE